VAEERQGPSLYRRFGTSICAEVAR
jgi:hypothetical protein